VYSYSKLGNNPENCKLNFDNACFAFRQFILPSVAYEVKTSRQVIIIPDLKKLIPQTDKI
jgi:hypothetical protein